MLKKALARAKQEHISRSDVTGVAISKKVRGGKDTGEECITIYVPKKLPKHLMTKSRLIEKEIDGVQTDVVEAVFEAQVVYGDWVDPLRPGISIGPESAMSSGTLGCLVYDIDAGTQYVLTNLHVVHGPMTYEYMCQPGRADGGQAFYDRFGRTKEYYLNSTGDAAIIEVDETLGREADSLVYGSDQRLLSILDAEIGDLVEKVGRTTGQTYGQVNAEGTYSIDYSAQGLGTVDVDGFGIVARDGADPGYVVSASGDSGSVWYDADEKQIKGLHFAGTATGELAIACSIETVFGTMSVSLNRRKAKSADGINAISLPWFSQSSEQETSIDIVSPGEFYNVYVFTESEFFGAVYARLSGTSEWMQVGGQTINPSCVLGNFENSKKTIVEFKIDGSELGIGERIIPIWFGHGEEVVWSGA